LTFLAFASYGISRCDFGVWFSISKMKLSFRTAWIWNIVTMFLRNVGKYSSSNTLSHHRTPCS